MTKKKHTPKRIWPAEILELVCTRCGETIEIPRKLTADMVISPAMLPCDCGVQAEAKFKRS